jgi:hypothetical protein
MAEYYLAGTVYPKNGKYFTTGELVEFNLMGPPKGNIIFKTRAGNSKTSSPFSITASSGFAPAPPGASGNITPDTLVVDSTGALLTTLAATYLLNHLDDVYKGISNPGSIFDKINSIYQGISSIDLKNPSSIFDKMNELMTASTGLNPLTAPSGGHILAFQSDAVLINTTNMSQTATLADGSPVYSGTLNKFDEASFVVPVTGKYKVSITARFGANPANLDLEVPKFGAFVIYTGGYWTGSLGNASTPINTTFATASATSVDWDINTEFHGDSYSDMFLNRVVHLTAGVPYYLNTFYATENHCNYMVVKIVEVIYTSMP